MSSKVHDHTPHETFTVAVYDTEEGGYWAEVLELPGCASQGETLDELRLNVEDAIVACLEAYADSQPAPERRTVATMSIRVALPRQASVD
jgi:predicted RNase H-like HicB family nuclease